VPGFLSQAAEARPGHHQLWRVSVPSRASPAEAEGTLTIDVLFDPGARFRNGLLATLSMTDIVPVPIHTFVRLIPLDLGTCAGLGFQISAFHFEAPIAFGRRRASAPNRLDALLISALRRNRRCANVSHEHTSSPRLRMSVDSFAFDFSGRLLVCHLAWQQADDPF